MAEQDAVVEEGASGGGGVDEGGSATLFVGGDVIEPEPQVGFLVDLLAQGVERPFDAGGGRSDLAGAGPEPAVGPFETLPGGGKPFACDLSGGRGAGECGGDPVELGGPVGGDGGFEASEGVVAVVGGVAESVGAVGERVAGSGARDDCGGPVLGELFPEAVDLGPAPAFGAGEGVGVGLGAKEAVDVVAGGGHRCGGLARPVGGRSGVPVKPAPFGPPMGSEDAQGAELVSLAFGSGQVQAGLGLLPLGLVEGVPGPAEVAGPVGWPAVEDVEVLGDLGAETAVGGVGVGDRGQAGVGGSGQGGEDVLVGGAGVGGAAAVVEVDDRGGVPGVGGLAGPGLADVAPEGVEGWCAEQVDGFPRAALGAVDGADPGVGQVG